MKCVSNVDDLTFDVMNKSPVNNTPSLVDFLVERGVLDLNTLLDLDYDELEMLCNEILYRKLSREKKLFLD